jgi:hypothetical protein
MMHGPGGTDLSNRICLSKSLAPSASAYATIEFKARKEGTQFVIAAQGIFLVDFDDALRRERSTQILINQLQQALHRQSMSARS